MKIHVSQLEPNPYRRMDHYPINRAKVNALRNSIQETGFWDNIVVRQHPEQAGKYQIAYGHHRLQAVKEQGITEVDIPVRPLTDIAMIRIMANENMDEWKSNVAVTNETVMTAKEFIENEVKKAGRNWQQLPEEIQGLWKDENYFARALRDDDAHKIMRIILGEHVIARFLGSNWDVNIVRQALSILNDPEIDREAVEEFASPAHAQTFIKAVKNINDRAGSVVIAKESQLELAQTIKAEITEEAEGKGRFKDITAEKIEHKVYQTFADIVKPPDAISKKDSMKKLLPAEEFKEWASWVSICAKVKKTKPIVGMSAPAKKEIRKMASVCIDTISEKTQEVS